MRKRRAADKLVVIGTFRKSPTELVEVRRQRLNGIDQIYLPVYSIGGGGKSEKGLCLTVESWRNEAIPMIQRAMGIDLPTGRPTSRRKPARRQTNDDASPLAIEKHCHECSGHDPAKCPIKSCPLFPHRMGVTGEAITTDKTIDPQTLENSRRRPAKDKGFSVEA